MLHNGEEGSIVVQWHKHASEEDLPKSHRRFLSALDLPSILAFCEVFGGEKLYIPRNEAIQIKVIRNRNILKSYRDGMPISYLAKEFQLTEMTIRRIIKASSA